MLSAPSTFKSRRILVILDEGAELLQKITDKIFAALNTATIPSLSPNPAGTAILRETAASAASRDNHPLAAALSAALVILFLSGCGHVGHRGSYINLNAACTSQHTETQNPGKSYETVTTHTPKCTWSLSANDVTLEQINMLTVDVYLLRKNMETSK